MTDEGEFSPQRTAAYRGELPVAGSAPIPCFVLDDGTRVISGRGLTNAIGMKGRGQGVPRIVANRTLAPFISDELKGQLESPIRFIGTTSRAKNPTTGYEATVLHSLCEAILVARDANALKTEQEQRYALYCDALIRAFAKVGIIALVDEATGYQEARAADELNRILEYYVAKELLPWTRKFPPEFYQELFRLRGWDYDMKSVKRPKYVGKLTNQIVYEKLPHPVLEELRRKNPRVTPSGTRRYKHHQLLTSDVGHPHLERHLATVTALMRISSSWREFERHLARAFPEPNAQGELDLELETDEG
ncbi:P63C domain-containing protein [Actinomycetospora aeridis]|uniref:P63C domain-containing protein n=1 Tax=Actinomycetospora aeridis TaxID=3129231 RepID=A0ABU8NAP1_9PSEU